MSKEIGLDEAAKEVDWAIPVDGVINVPDELDTLVNKIGFQLRFHTISGKGEIETICRIARIAQQFFYEWQKNKEPEQAEGKVKWQYCPECGSNEIVNENIVKNGYRECKDCGQEWWTDIDYTDTIKIVLQNRKRHINLLKEKNQQPEWVVKWVNSSERLPDLVMTVNLKVCGRPGYGKFYKEDGVTKLGFEASNGWGTFEEHQFIDILWLEETAYSVHKTSD